ncbi:MAG TPA: alpha/beta fold hydrolase [Usitatibacter sp.]|nr:alpha/beta fold hydrolase [Usitatibacter sp.]
MSIPPGRTLLHGAAGAIEVATAMPSAPVAIAVIAHPHPLFGGTMDNKVVTTVARAFQEAGAATFRFNFRGVGASEGPHDEGRGETDDMVQVIEHARAVAGALPLMIAGFSFGGAVATRASDRVEFQRLLLVAPGFRRLTEGGLGETPDPADPNLGSPGRHTHANTVLIHGDLDETVPLADSIAWATVREVPVVVVPGGEHFFHRKLHILREVVAHWAR